MYRLLFFLIITLTISCSSKRLSPDFRVGASEAEWNDSIKSLLKTGKLKYAYDSDTLSFEYNLKITDTLYDCILMLNNDGISKGKLRVISYSFANNKGVRNANLNSSDPQYPNPAEDSLLYEVLSWEGALVSRAESGKMSSISLLEIFPKQHYDRVYTHILELYGQPDSICDRNGSRLDTINYKNHIVKDVLFHPTKEKAVKSSREKPDFSWISKSFIDQGIDTSLIKYFFHSKNSVVVLERSQLFQPNYFIPFQHFTKTLLYEYVNLYDSELNAVMVELSKNLKPNELITVPFDYTIERRILEYGITRTYVNLSGRLEPGLRKTEVERREIESMKGSIIVKDKYGTILQNLSNVEIKSNGSLPSKGEIGLVRVTGNNHIMNNYTMAEYSAQLYLDSYESTEAFKQAVNLNYDLFIEFVPNVILFTDGTLLK